MSKKQIDFVLTIDNNKFRAALNKTGNQVSKFSSSVAKQLKPASTAFLSLGKNIGFAGAAAATAAAAGGFYAINKVMKDSVSLTNEQEKAEIKLAGVLKATGHAAGFSLSQLKAMASEMQDMTGVGDELTLSNMGILATFKEVKGDNFRLATKAAIDMSAVLEQDLKSSVLQLGKALNDPTKGMSALTRSGVSFTESQKEQVKNLQESGKVFEAQTLILREMESQFGGVAEAMRQTFGGKFKAMLGNLGDFQEEIGFAVTKNTFFLESIELLGNKFKDLGVYMNQNREKTLEWAKQGALSGLTFAEGLTAGADYLYRGFSGIQGLFQATAASALKISGGIFSVIEAAAKLSDQLHLTEGAAEQWGVNAQAAFAGADDLFAKAAENFNDMTNGSSKLKVVQESIAAFRSELEKIEATEVDPAKSFKEADPFGPAKQDIKEVEGDIVNLGDNFRTTAINMGVDAAEQLDKMEQNFERFTNKHRVVNIEVREVQAKASGGLIHRLAAGGKLPGYGGGDRIPALLEAGEFVLRKEAVAKYGAAFMSNLNAMKLNASELLRFKLGGIIQSTKVNPGVQHFQSGGQVQQAAASGNTINVTLNYSGSGASPHQDAKGMARILQRELDELAWGRS